MEACKLNIFAFALFSVISLQTVGQCTPPGGVPIIACGTGTPLTDNVTISSGTFSANGGSFSGVNVDGGTLVLCGTVTIANFNLNTGSVVINPGASATFNGNFNTNGGGVYNLGSTTYNTDVRLQGSDAFCYTDPAASTTVNGTLAVFNTGVFYHNGKASAQSVIINTGAAICLASGSTVDIFSLVNNQSNSFSVPSGSACIHYTGSLNANNALISSGGTLILCKDPVASAPTGNIGTAVLASNCSSCQAALPVRLVSFTGTRNGSSVELKWTTNLEDNLNYFAIQRSSDGQNFHTADTVAAHDKPSSYDLTTSIDVSSYFRLQMIDKDDKYTYSAIVAIEMPVIAFNISILPNPVRQSWLSISVNTPTNQNGELTVLDMTGRPLKKLPVFLQAGKNNLPLPLDGLSTGYYYLHFDGTSGQSRTLPFIKF